MALLTGGVDMSEVKRYDLCKYQNGYAEMESSIDGEWVDYTDYVKLEQQLKDMETGSYEIGMLFKLEQQENIKLEQQKAELLQAIESALNKSTKGGWLYRIFENIIEKYNIKI